MPARTDTRKSPPDGGAARADGAMQEIRPTVWIGKSGMTDGILQEIADQLATRKVIKVKWLRNIGVEPETVAEKTGATLVSVRGRTMVLARGKRQPGRAR